MDLAISLVSATKQARTDEDGTLHELYRAAVFVGGECLGEFGFDSGLPHLRWRRTGIAYFCPACGDIWARLVFWESDGQQSLLDCERISCENHEDQWEVPGSLIFSGIEGLVELLPEAALRREIEVHMRYMEKKR